MLAQVYERKRQRLELLQKNRVLANFPSVIDEKRMDVDVLTRRLETEYQKILTENRHKVTTAAARLDAINPLAVLRRGFALAETDGVPLKSIKDVATGDSLDVRLQDGRVRCEAKEIVKE